jgi:hypothetical protein
MDLRDMSCKMCAGQHGPRSRFFIIGANQMPEISGGAIAPLALMLLPLLPQLIDSALRIYEQIANHPTTPEASAVQIRGYITNIRAINAEIQRAPLPGDEP